MARHVTKMTLFDAEHYSDEQRATIIESYPEYERQARVYGEPSVGSGRIFPFSEEVVKCDPFARPAHWPLVAAMDFGWDHPTAAVLVWWDREGDVMYVTQSYRQSRQTPRVHAAALKQWGKDFSEPGLPWAWPHDGLQHDKGSGQQLASLYRQEGLNMQPGPVQFPEGGNSVEAGLMLMYQRLQSGRLKVFASCSDWFEEFRLYHRKDGQVVKQQDDLMAATRYALMALAQARLPTRQDRRRRGPSDSRFNPFDW